MDEQLTIKTWNCHSLYSKLLHFKIRLYADKPHIVCLCETWLKPSRLPTFINYKPFFFCRSDRPGGGTAILVRNDICVSEKKINYFDLGSLEIQAVTIHNNNANIDILNLYNPNKTVSQLEFEYYFDQLSRRKIIVGDLNSHSKLWDINSEENTTGNNLVSALTNYPDICLLTPLNLPTYYHIPTRKFSTLDLCFVSPDLYPSSHIELTEDMGSDHTPLLIHINLKPTLCPTRRRKRWIFGGEKSWEEWRKKLPPVMDTIVDTEESSTKFVSALIDTSHEVFKTTKEIVTPKYSKIWWSAECEEALSQTAIGGESNKTKESRGHHTKSYKESKKRVL